MSAFIITVVAFIAAAIIALRIWWWLEKRKRKTIYSIVISGIADIDGVAAAAQMDYSSTEKRLKKIVNHANSNRESSYEWNEFEGSFIDYNKKRVVLKTKESVEEETSNKPGFLTSLSYIVAKKPIPIPEPDKKEQSKENVVVCKGCGSKVILDSSVVFCEFCGAPLDEES